MRELQRKISEFLGDQVEEDLVVVSFHHTEYTVYCYLCGELVNRWATVVDPVSGYEIICLECLESFA